MEYENSSNENIKNPEELARMPNKTERPTLKKSITNNYDNSYHNQNTDYDRNKNRDVSRDRHNNARTPKKLAMKHNFPVELSQDPFQDLPNIHASKKDYFDNTRESDLNKSSPMMPNPIASSVVSLINNTLNLSKDKKVPTNIKNNFNRAATTNDKSVDKHENP